MIAVDIVAAGAVAEDILVAAGDNRAVAEDILVAAGGILAVEADTGAAEAVPAATGRKHIQRTTSERDTLLQGPNCMKRIFWT
jgi:hypothetical protein